MKGFHKDFLVTYDPGYFEEHLESSEFEEGIPSVSPKNSNQYLIITDNNKATKKQKDNWNRKIHRNYHSNLQNPKHIHTILDRKNGSIELAAEHVYVNRNLLQSHVNYKEKKSLIRHKVIPCLSSIFGRSVSKLSPKEIQPKNVCKDNSCQVESTSNLQRRKPIFLQQLKITAQPIYELDGGIGEQMLFGAKDKAHAITYDNNKSVKRVLSNIVCNVALNENDIKKIEKLKNRKYKKRLKYELMEANLKLKYNTNKRHYCQQFPSKQSLYHVFTASNHGQYNVAKPQKLNKSLNSELSVTSSGFWDYLLEKFNKKSKSNKPNPFKQCQRKDFALQCCPVNLDKSSYGPYTESKRNRQVTNYYEEDDDCPCSDTSINYPRTVCKDFAQNYVTPPLPERSKQTESKNIQCECPPPKRRQTTVPRQYLPTPIQPQEKACGCQQPHDQMADSVANKYNGEILCIHNPPCILINGCLNVTQPSDATPVNAWPVVESKKNSLFRGYKTKRAKQKQEQFSQYHAQSVEVRQCQTPEKKNEKIIQSICDHSPPCEVVRCCHKPKFDRKLHNSCVHVPMCTKVPECLIQKGRENKTLGTCEHKPKCPEVPLCTRKYVPLTAKGSIGTQIKPQTKMFCRHDPPCVLIPKCLVGAVQGTYISYEAIPSCVHQPLCDLIPACCRKSTKGMVSAYCQYPNGCRMV